LVGGYQSRRKRSPSWGAPRIHGELLKLGIHVAESSVTKYMVRNRKPPSQTWRTFLENHAQQLVSIDFLRVPTIRFQVLYVFLVLAHCCATAMQSSAMTSKNRYAIQPPEMGTIVALPQVGGLHHRYERRAA